MGGTDNTHARLAQAQHVAPLLRVRQRIAHVGKILMAVATHKLVIGTSIEPEAVAPAELRLAYAHAHHAAVHTASAVNHLQLHPI